MQAALVALQTSSDFREGLFWAAPFSLIETRRVFGSSSYRIASAKMIPIVVRVLLRLHRVGVDGEFSVYPSFTGTPLCPEMSGVGNI